MKGPAMSDRNEQLRNRLRKIRSDLDELEIELNERPTLPEPEEVRKRGGELISLGRFEKWFAFAAKASPKRVVIYLIAAIPTFNHLVTTAKNAEYVVEKGSGGANFVSAILEKAQNRPDVPADKFVCVPPARRNVIDALAPNTAGGADSGPVVVTPGTAHLRLTTYAPIVTVSNTTTTTPAPKQESSDGLELTPGSSLVPYSEKWDEFI